MCLRRVCGFAGPSRPQELKLPSEIFYASATNCTGPALLSAARIKFQAALQSVIRTQPACETSPGDCIVEDVIATCQRHPDAPLTRPGGTGAGAGGRGRRGGRRIQGQGDGEEQEDGQSRGGASRLRARATRYIPDGAAGGGTASPGTALASGVESERAGNRSDFILPIQFHFGTRVAGSGGTWPDEYQKASHRLFAMFDFFERQVVGGAFSIAQLVAGLHLTPLHDSLTFAPALAICDITYTFNTDILLCGKCSLYSSLAVILYLFCYVVSVAFIAR
jgi:hypothetical protein